MTARAATFAFLLALAPIALAHGATVPKARIAASCGVVPVSTRLSANGFLVDFRYRVTDAELAMPLFRDGVKTSLVDRTTGKKLLSPSDSKLGSLRSSPRTTPTAGKVYYILFSNPARMLHAGSRVDVTMGSCRLRQLLVR